MVGNHALSSKLPKELEVDNDLVEPEEVDGYKNEK